MANQFKKDKIDFDVYERRDPDSQVNWAKAAQDITKTFEGIRDERQGRKDELEAMITEQQNALNDIGSYDSPTLQQVALDASNDSANKLNDQANLMRRGLIKPHEMQKFKANQSSGWTQFKKNAESWNNKYNEYTKRTTDGANSKIEQEIATQLSGFNNLKNLQFMSNAETGEMSYARTDDEGNILPGESVSINQMTNLLNQKVDAFDLNASVLETKGRLGTIITATIDPQGIRTDITTEEMSRAESDYFGTDAGKETLRLEAAAMISVPMDAATMLVTNATMDDGSQYITDLGGAKHDEFAKANPGKPNPYVALRYDGNQYVPDITEDQMGAAQQYAENKLKNSLDIKETAKSQKIQATPPPQPSAASIAKGEKDEKLLSQGKNLMLAVSGDPKEAEAGLRYLVDASNGNVEYINKTEGGFMIKYPGKDEVPVSTQITREATQEDVDEAIKLDPNSKLKVGAEIKEDMSPIEAMRVTWKAAGLQDAEFDAWLAAGGNELLKDRKLTTDAVSVKGPQSSIEYDTQAMVLLDGNEVSAVDFIVDGPLGKSPSSLEFNTNAEFINEYSNLLNQESFFPKGIGNGKITMDGDKMTFTIGGKPYAIGDVFGQNTTETVALLQEAIQQAISNRSKGGNASKY